MDSAPTVVDMGAAVAAIVVAAGRGARFGGPTNKLYVALDGMPLLAHAVQALQQSGSIRWIILVVGKEDGSRAKELITRYRWDKVLRLGVGGASRAESVAHGFALVPKDARWIVVHDGARPCVGHALMDRTVRAARRYGAAGGGIPSPLTVKAVDGQHMVRLTLDRESLWLAQTPQAFRREWFAEALARCGSRLSEFPDDAALVEAAGFPVRMVRADASNIKVTTPDDLVFAEAILHRRHQTSGDTRQDVDVRNQVGEVSGHLTADLRDLLSGQSS